MRILLLTIVVLFLSACTSEEFDKTSTLAERGNARAQLNLGVMHHKGQGVTQDYKQAVKWYRKAAEQGHAGAQYLLALSYANGEGVAQDDKQAVYWYEKSAEQGNPASQKSLELLLIECPHLR